MPAINRPLNHLPASLSDASSMADSTAPSRLFAAPHRPTGTIRRMVAFIVDVLILSGLLFGVAVISSALLGPAITFAPSGGLDYGVVSSGNQLLLVSTASSVVLSAGYFVVSWVGFYGTPGQHLLGLRVWDQERGGRITIGRGFVRWVLLGAPIWIASTTIPGQIGLAAAAGAVTWMAVLLLSTARSFTRQGVHDRWAHSIVVKPQYGIPPMLPSKEV
jgi:uncharacterized RDD family membrane protein YckC